MAEDPYTLLGVPRDATDKQIRSAFLKRAKSSHPDLNPGDPKAEERFKALNAANDILSDPDRRARYDRGEIDAAGQERAPPPPPRGGFGDADDINDIFASMFNARRQGTPRNGANRRYTLTVAFLDAINGATQRITVPEGGTLDVRIPPGTESGQVLRLRGKGAPGNPPGDALIEIEVAPHKTFRREGQDIQIDLPVTVAEAILGGKVTVPTISGPVNMTLPANAESGTRLRLRGKGLPAMGALPAGDAYATIRIVLGPKDEGLAEFLRTRKDTPSFNPREET